MRSTISEKIVHAIYQMLLHSLWQGLLLAIMVGVVILLTGRSTSRLRYNLLAISFLLFVVMTSVTFVNSLFETPYITGQSSLSLIFQPVDFAGQTAPAATPAKDIKGFSWQGIIAFLDANSSLVVAGWLIFFAGNLFRLFSNLCYVHRLRRQETCDPLPYWRNRLDQLASELHLCQGIQLLESAIIKVPVVIGYLKPVILIPAGLLSNLPQEQVEAILTHELAHIRRKDYLVNLLQLWVETIFFFNPAVRWVSNLLREERENCCDEIAVTTFASKKHFIEALLNFHEFAAGHSKGNGVLAFAGKKNYLLNRVKRIMLNENKKLNTMEKGFFFASILFASLLGFIMLKPLNAREPGFSTASKDHSMPRNGQTVAPATATDTVPVQPGFSHLSSSTTFDNGVETKTINATGKDGTKYKLVTAGGSIDLYVNDQKIPAQELDKYKDVVTAFKLEVEERQKADEASVRMRQLQQTTRLKKLDTERLQLLKQLAELDEQRENLNNNKMERSDHLNNDEVLKMKLMQENLANVKGELVQKQLSKETNLLLNKTQNEQLLQKAEIDAKLDNQMQEKRLQEYKAALQLNQDNSEKQELQNQQLILKEKLELLQQQQLELKPSALGGKIEPIIHDLSKAGLLDASQEEYSFELNSNKLVVNGRKQPASVAQQLIKKYIRNKKDAYLYEKKGESISSSIHIE